MNTWVHEPEHRRWLRFSDGKLFAIRQTSGTAFPFCCYAGSKYLGPAATLEAAKIKCEKLQSSSREPAPDEPAQEPVRKAARTGNLTRRSR